MRDNLMTHDEIVLANLYISLQIALAKKKLFEEKNCTVPEGLLIRLKNIEAAIAELEESV